jgi:LuxR family maltose regulon positive regulatory protein
MLNGPLPVGTKTSVPRLAPHLVARPRLELLLSEEARRPVTLVCGPPGAGKTTLLASALSPSATDRSVTWLCLDERDNDCRRLAALLHAALAPSFDDELAPFVDQAGPLVGRPMLDVLDELLGRIALHDEAQVLVLDDVHELRSESALVALGHLIRHAPPQLDLVLSSRADPPVGLELLRLDERLNEIRNADLAFSQSETAELLALHEVALDNVDMRSLWARTEGWAAGLRLAACALQTESDPGRFVRSAARTEAVVSDYLLRELLVRKDDAVQWFLLRTSVAERLTVELAEQLSDDPRASEYLGDLERSGVLVTEEGEGGWYRYHALFGALLRARMERHDPDLTRELHGQAAQWCLQHEMPVEAQRHALAAQDWEVLGQLVAWRWIDATLDGGGCTDDADLLPAGVDDSVVSTTTGLALVAAAEACRRADREAADLYRSALDGLLDGSRSGIHQDFETWDNERLVLDVLMGCSFGSDERALRASVQLQNAAVGDPAAAGLRHLGVLRGAELALDRGDFDVAARDLADLSDRAEGGWVGAEAAAFLTLLHAASGRPAEAEALVDPKPCFDADLDGGGSGSVDRAFFGGRWAWTTPQASHASRLAVALVHALRGEQRCAAELLATAVAPPTGLASRSLRMVERAVRAGITTGSGRTVPMDAVAVAHPLAERALVALGVFEVITPEGRLVPVGGPGERAVNSGRARLASDDVARADEAVVPWLATDIRGSHPRTQVEAAVVAALAAGGRGEHRVARQRLVEALDLAEASGVGTPFLQHGSRLAPLLQRNLCELGDRMGPALDLLDRTRPSSSSDLVEPLTDREMEVLVHLPTLMSNVEIASGLHLSVNTVKTHLKAVYRKLGVAGRRQAVVRGRELELI